MTKKINAKIDIWYWDEFTNAYLESAQLLVGKINDEQCDSVLGIVALHNMKHGIELFLKTAIMYFDGGRCIDKIHNITTLFESFKERQQKESKLIEKHLEDVYREIPPGTPINNDFKSNLEELEKMVIKYDKVILERPSDPKNDYYRFPDNDISSSNKDMIDPVEKDYFKHLMGDKQLPDIEGDAVMLKGYLGFIEQYVSWRNEGKKKNK